MAEKAEKKPDAAAAAAAGEKKDAKGAKAAGGGAAALLTKTPVMMGGVMLLEGKVWRIEQYNLSVPIPNAIFDEVKKLIAVHLAKPKA